MKENVYFLCKKSDDGLYIPQTGPIVLTGGDLTYDQLLGFASHNNLIVVFLAAK